MKTKVLNTDKAKPLTNFFRRFNAIIFFLLVSACLFIAILLLLPITNLSSEESQTSGKTIDSSFDQGTIDRLRSGGATSAHQPGERTSPFSE